MGSGMKEAVENRIYIDDFTFEAVKLVIEYLYERNIRNKINEENAYELLHFADKYDVRGLKHVLQDVLMQKITVPNVCMFANMSITSNAHELRECCICFLLKCVGKSVIADVQALDDEISCEVGRRSLL
uniref:BTB domain-containing protein n=1 Tax=Panagrolaimus davidi TaxID=227884 RepID=A0A914PZ71_9BILA